MFRNKIMENVTGNRLMLGDTVGKKTAHTTRADNSLSRNRSFGEVV